MMMHLIFPDGTIPALLNDVSILTEILTYHIHQDSVTSNMYVNGMLHTLHGTNVNVFIANGNLYINNAMVTVADIIAENGVVHVIDAVLLPDFEDNSDEYIEISPGTASSGDNLNVSISGVNVSFSGVL